jgi:hypothetical protein
MERDAKRWREMQRGAKSRKEMQRGGESKKKSWGMSIVNCLQEHPPTPAYLVM